MKRTGRAILRITEVLLYGFCLLLSYLHGMSGQVGFSITYALLGLVYVWLIAGAPHPRAVAVETLRAVTGRSKPDYRRIAELELQFTEGTDDEHHNTS